MSKPINIRKLNQVATANNDIARNKMDSLKEFPNSKECQSKLETLCYNELSNYSKAKEKFG